ncbi:hypothetical protein Terro_3608 [Terriglobus roseus DSM 18391]|uniref:Glycosyltransferase RgtA/B/C/D-like domain-containing protein n=2 Tax=Terriglobus roseus TaxID=392734 RepID=I3ZKQ4_TERRK|nr:hypothetical protein Terro_3608 [Terriglobus roseus DSM 18391]
MDRAPLSRTKFGAPALPRWFWPVAFLAAAWVAIWLFVTRDAMLDDSLIHLRYAVNLQRLHFVTYDGIHHTFGTSSPLYVSVLALGYQVWHSVFVPKMCSVVGYLALLGLSVALYLRVRHQQVAGALALLFLPVVLCPMAIRWLTDGMETSLVCASVVLLAFLTFAAAKSPWRMSGGLLMFLMGFYVTTLRIELASLCAFTALTIFLARRHRGDGPLLRTAMQAMPVLVGSVAALLLMRWIFGNFLPDTALAKASGTPGLAAFFLFFHVSGSAALLGVGSFILLVVTAVFAWRHTQVEDGNGRLAFLAANLNLPFILLLSSIRGQAIQAVRYVLWAMFFGIVWNLLTMAASGARERWMPAEKTAVYGTAILFLVLLPLDIWFGGHTMLGHAQAFDQMRDESLDRLAGHTMLADDIGFIGYFSQANVCDMNGLINGRKFAALSQVQRLQSCADQHPDAIFLTVPRISMMGRYIPHLTEEWIACERVDFFNVRTSDRHYLLIRKVDAERLCPRNTTLRMPISDIPQVAAAGVF